MVSKSTYTTRRRKMDDLINSAVLKKYNRIHDTGMQALRNGDVTPYPGLDDPAEREKLQRQTITAVLFTQKSVMAFLQKVAGHITRIIEEELRYRMIIAGHNYPLHSTIFTGEPFENPSKNAVAKAVNKLKGMSLTFDCIMANGANILMATSKIPKEVTATRSKLIAIYQNSGIEPRSYENILHITASRMVTLSKAFPMTVYAIAVEQLKMHLSQEPLELTVEKVLTTSTYELLTM